MSRGARGTAHSVRVGCGARLRGHGRPGVKHTLAGLASRGGARIYWQGRMRVTAIGFVSHTYSVPVHVCLTRCARHWDACITVDQLGGLSLHGGRWPIVSCLHHPRPAGRWPIASLGTYPLLGGGLSPHGVMGMACRLSGGSSFLGGRLSPHGVTARCTAMLPSTTRMHCAAAA